MDYIRKTIRIRAHQPDFAERLEEISLDVFAEISLDVFAGYREATHAKVAMFQAGIGSRLWLSGSTRVDLAAHVSLLGSCLQNMMYSNLVDLNKTVRKAKRGSALSVLPAAQRASSQRYFYR